MKTPGHSITCVICGKTVEEWGNNALPIKKGTCCDECNRDKVTPERLRRMKAWMKSSKSSASN